MTNKDEKDCHVPSMLVPSGKLPLHRCFAHTVTSLRDERHLHSCPQLYAGLLLKHSHVFVYLD